MNTFQAVILFAFLVLLPLTLVVEFHYRGRVSWRGRPVGRRWQRSIEAPEATDSH